MLDGRRNFHPKFERRELAASAAQLVVGYRISEQRVFGWRHSRGARRKLAKLARSQRRQFADARTEDASWQPCLDKNNLGPIVALLLIQNVSDVEAHAMTLLRHISPHFEGFGLGDLILVEPVLICLELLKAAGEAEEERKSHVSSEIV